MDKGFKMRWTSCWKCEEDINKKEDCNYIKTRDINVDLCPNCYSKFKICAKDFLALEKAKLNKIHNTIFKAISDLHDKEHEGDMSDCKLCEMACNLISDKRRAVLNELQGIE
jgi:hypothetical protein